MQTSREGFRVALDVSAYSLISLARVAAPLMEKRGGSILTLTLSRQPARLPELQRDGRGEGGARSVGAVPGQRSRGANIRVNAISAGPIKTLAAAGISGFSSILQVYRERAPLKRNVELAEVADAAMFLLGAGSRAVTGEILLVDAGYSHQMGL